MLCFCFVFVLFSSMRMVRDKGSEGDWSMVKGLLFVQKLKKMVEVGSLGAVVWVKLSDRSSVIVFLER